MLRCQGLMVKIVKNTIGMCCLWVKERIFRGRFPTQAAIGIVPQPIIGILAGGMVIDHIQNNRYSPAMAFVYEGLKGILGTIVFIQCHMERRIIAPTLVPIELAYRHQLNGIDSQVLQIIQSIPKGIKAMQLIEIPQQYLVNNQIGFLRSNKVRSLPSVFSIPGTQYSNG